MSPRFITLEGGEGTGKSTQMQRLASALREKGLGVVTTREPGGSSGAEEIRALLVNGAPGRWDALTETLLVYAARADHVKRTIGPALVAGNWVVCDRFTDSTYAYQGAGRGLARETIRRVDAIVLDDFKPDLTLILDLDVEIGLERAKARAQANQSDAEQRFENFDRAFHDRLRQCFLDIAKRNPNRCLVIDAAPDADQVAAAIWSAVAQRFGI
jgi:dTMP kinase